MIARATRRFLFALALLFCPLAAHAAERPNIVVFLSDDHTRNDSSVYGAKDIATPHMERLAAAGMTFENAFVVSPSCAPSRAALLTGLLPQRNGAEANHAKPRDEFKKLPAYLRELGYEVVAFGKVGHYAQTKDCGFDLARHFTYHDDVAVGEAVKWLDARTNEKPLALFVGCNWPHVPWPAEAPGVDPAKLAVPPHHADTPATREWRARYVAAVQTMDRELGLVLDAARRRLGDDTLFLHTSDHGAQWPFGKWTLYDDGLRTPLIVSWPGKIAPGQRTAAMVSWLDILPTLLEAAGGTAPAEIDGRSFLPVLLGKTGAHRDRVFATHSGDGANNVYPMRALRTLDGWKYIRNLHPEFRFTAHITTGSSDGGYWPSWREAAKTDATAAALVKRYHERPSEELYDLTSDPYEQRNLAAEPAQAPRLAAMRAELDQWMRSTGDTQRVFGEPNLLSEPERQIAPKRKQETMRKTAVSIVGEAFHINGEPTYRGREWRGHKVEGLLMNSRMVQGIFDDRNPETAARWAYPDTRQWDAERNTGEFLAAMPEWRRHGLLAFTINLQGGSPEGYSREQPWHNSAFEADGSLRADYAARLARILDRADELGMVAIVGYFYFGQDERLRDEAAVLRATDAATQWLLDGGWRNVLVEVNNECNVRYDHAILRPERVHELIARVKSAQRDGRRLLASTSYGGNTVPRENVVRASDFLLLHGNGVKEPRRIAEMVHQTRAVPGYTPKPILFNEDDHFDFDQPDNNFIAALSERASWGYFDFRMKGEKFDDGYQSVPVNWGLSSERKRGFFRLLAEITGGAVSP